MTQSSQYTTERLEAIQRAESRAARMAWSAGALAVVSLLVLAFAYADDRLVWPLAVRWLGLLLLAGILAGASARLWQLSRRSKAPKKTALKLEGRRPEMGCVVSTAAEYSEGKHAAAREYEPELVEALQQAAAKKMRGVEIPNHRGRIAAALAVLALPLAALALFVWFAPQGGTAVVRVTCPWAGMTYTRIDVKPGDAEVATGHNLTVQAAFHGRQPSDARLLWRMAQASLWQTVPLSLSENGAGRGDIANVTNAAVYKVAGGDAVSPEFSIRTFNAPEVKSVVTKVDYPNYTRHAPREETEADLRVVRGSQLAFRVATAGEVASAKMIFTNQPPIELARDANNQWTASLTARSSSDYRIELTDKSGRKAASEPYHLVVVPDAPPQVDVVDPQADVRADPADKVPLKISASDDFAVTGIKVVFNKLGQPEQSVVCEATNLNQPEASARAEIDLTPLHLQPYELVAYHAEASDNNTLDGPGTGKSPVYFIEMTTNSETVSSESHSQAQKINLLELEKQIITATTAVPDDKTREKLPDVAAVQRQTREYAETFKENSAVLAAAPPEARSEFDAALSSMDGAIKSLDAIQRDPALGSEEDALKHLYQAVRYFPPLKPCMCNCTGIKIVAEAIEKKKDEEKKKRDQELPKVIAQAKKVAAAQAQLNGLYRKSAENSPSETAANAAKPAPKNGAGSAGGQPQNNNPTAANNTGTENPNAQNNDDQKPGAGSPSDEQKKLADQAGQLADKLRALAGNDPRVSGRHAQHMNEVAENMRKAAGFAGANNLNEAEATGRTAYGQIEDIVGALEILANDQPHASETADEEYPKEYEQPIADYLRTLSYQK